MLGAIGGGGIFYFHSIFHSGGGDAGLFRDTRWGIPERGQALNFAEFAFHGAGVAFGRAGGAGAGGGVLSVHRLAQAL